MSQSQQRTFAGLLIAGFLIAQLVSCASTQDGINHDRVVEQLASELESAYVFPDIGKRYAESLRAEPKSTYHGVEADAFAKMLSVRLQEVHADAHLRVEYFDTELESPKLPESDRREKSPPAIEAAQWLAPDVSYLRANLFPCDEATVTAVARFMDDHVGSKTLILDVRGHRGGGLAEMDVLFAELFSEETVLLHMETRKSVDDSGGSPIRDGATVRRIEAPEGVVRRTHMAVPGTNPRYVNTKVYVLVSGYTASAAEHLALALKRTGRGVVVGEATRGGAHYGGTALLDDGFSVFVPVGRTFDPDTNEDWESVGVTPDHPADAPMALIVALIDAGIDSVEARRINAMLGYSPPSRPK